MAVTIVILGILSAAAWKRLPAYDLFINGAKQGLHTALQVLPNLAAMLCAISLMQASGLMSALCALCAPALEWMGLPSGVAPLVLLRPMSGSASLAMLERLLDQFGPDSRTGLIASTLMGSSETIFYTVCVYMSAVSVKGTGYAIPCSLVGALAGVWLSTRLF
ncbi:MAG: spore maturation protein [Clostridia bacterium]|nr:spore maturation protein [Clostridia bacterium]